MGWVEDSQGIPVPGAVVSVFGRGVGSRGLVTLSDGAGRFFLPSLPAGSYTLRALGRGHRPAPAQRVTIVPDQNAVFSLSLTRLADLSAEQIEERTREIRWLLRHKARSVLESRDPLARRARLDRAPSSERGDLGAAALDGELQVVANPAALGVDTPALADDLPSSFSAVRFGGRVAGLGEWSLGGLVAESENASWRMATDFVTEAWAGHQIQAGAGYGSRVVRPAIPGPAAESLESRGVGALFVNDRWSAGNVGGSFGLRYSYIGYLEDANHVDPSASLEVRREDGTTIRGSVSARTLAPGGDLLTLSTLSAGPAIAFAHLETGLRPERAVRYELALVRSVGRTTLSAHTFYEGVRDQLVNAFDGPVPSRGLRLFNAGGLASRGVGLTLSHEFGDAVTGTVTYVYGRGWREKLPAQSALDPMLAFHEASFHDLVTRLETVIDRSGTRVQAYYRINTLTPDENAPTMLANSRFDVLVRQGLPLIGSLTRAEWEVLVAYRNIFYEASESATLDELTVVNPPKRVLGGIAVRF